MRITILGKGGSGKTTLSMLLTLHASKKLKNAVAIDADLNDHFGEYIGFQKKAPALGHAFNELTGYLFEKRKIEVTPAIGTIPPTLHSRFIRVSNQDHFFQTYALKKGNLHYLNVGGYEKKDAGIACFHGNLNALELVMHYLLDTPDDGIILDSAAGTDVLATSLYFLSDIYFFVIEPTRQSISVYQDYINALKFKIPQYKIKIIPVVNKCVQDTDLSFVQNELGLSQGELLTFPFDPMFRILEQGNPHEATKLAQKYENSLNHLFSLAQAQRRDDALYLRNLHATFTDECRKWVNDTYKKNMEDLIDPNFSYDLVR